MGQKTILVVDDDPVNIEMIRQALKGDYRIRAAVNGEMALKAVAVEPPPDLVILDIMMPGMDGHEVCRRFKDDPKMRSIPVIFLTAKSEVEDETQGFQEGAVDYIHKPISPPILQARVQTHLALKEARDQLQKQNEVLEHLVRQRTAELAAALERALAAGKAKTAFLQTMSHELRTPLNHILGYAEMLEEELSENPELIKDLNRIRSSGRHLLAMIAGVLEYARNEGAEDVLFQEVNVVSIAKNAAGNCADAIRKNNNDLEVQAEEAEVPASTDARRLESIVTELIRNAAKFTSGGRITLSVKRPQREVIALDVADTGIGMTPDQIERCFDAFWQADASTSRAYEGTGMGLAMARQLAQQIGAKLTVQSDAGKGSIFRLLLPAGL